MPQLIEIAFKGNRKEFFLWEPDEAPPLHAAVLVDADRGEDLGRVHATGELAAKRAAGVSHAPTAERPARQAKRLATPEEIRRYTEVRAQDEDARRKSMERVKANGLVMKLTDAEWQFDRKKLTIYFTSEKRVDFRTLVRDLASLFRTRIELKQIGVRDEARRLSGVGRCGREYCSASWLPELRPVNLGVAKDQRLSLNPSQISGACGRLMCCLRYEHDFYVTSRKRFPKEGKILYTSRGEEKVIANDIFNDRVTLKNADGEMRVLALADLKVEIATGGTEIMTTTAEMEAVVLPEELDEELIRLQDTAERPVFRPGMSPPRRAPERPVTSTRPVVTPPVETPAPAPPAASESAADTDAASTGRPRRRRGRRGGRRGRGSAGGASSGSAGSPGSTGAEREADDESSSADGSEDE